MAVIPKSDEAFLRDKGFDFTLVGQNGETQLILRDWPFPSAYNPRLADILIVIPSGYPMAALDMFWTYPHVRLTNGGTPQACQHSETKADGRHWQRWSRHGNWRSGIDNLRSFITAMSLEIDKGI